MKLKTHTITLLATFALCANAFAQDADKVDAKAKGIMDQSATFLQGLKSLQVDTTFNIKMSSSNPAFGGEDINESLDQKLNVQLPHQFSLVTEGEATQMGGADAYYNKGNGAVVIGDQGAIEVEGLESLQDFFISEKLGYQSDAGMNPFFDQNIAVATLKSIILPKAGETWDENLESMRYIGEEEVGGTKAHRLNLVATQNIMGQEQSMGMDLWVAVGDEPVLLKVAPDMESILKAMGGADNPMLADMKMDVSGTYANWKINPEIAEENFNANLADIEKYDDFMGLMQAIMGGGPEADPADQLSGQPAPDFTLDLLAGESFTLSDHKGKVVILDFWATWCGPCVRAIPELLSVAADYAGKGVVLVGVNQREDAETISGFLKKKKWDLTVALDQQGAVGDKFFVQGIPQTVIVGKDGTVKKVHVGFAPGLKDQIAKELDELLAE